MPYGKLYETKRTTPTYIDFCKSFIKVWKNKFGYVPNENSCYVIMAQFALETGFGVNCYNWNLGNIKKIKGDSHKDGYVQLKGVWEIVNGKKVYYPKEAPQSYFRNYFSLDHGMAGYLSLLSTKRYGNSFEALKEGDVEKYSKALKSAGYYTASEAHYTAAMKGMFAKFSKENHYKNAISTIENESPIIKPVESVKPDTNQDIISDVLQPEKIIKQDGKFGMIMRVLFPLLNFIKKK